MIGAYKLTLAEEQYAHQVALKRMLDTNCTQYDKSNNGNLGTRITYHELVSMNAEGVSGEMIAARYFGIKDFDPMLSELGAADFYLANGRGVEVRTTRWTDGSLFVKERDKPDCVGVLVVGFSPNYWVTGWIPISDAKKERYVNKLGGWTVTQANLHSPETLLRSTSGNPSISV